MAKTTALTKRIDFDLALLPVIQNLATLGKSEADIGVIIGYAGRKPGKFIERLKKQYPDVAIALEVGRKLADTELVTTAFEAATGYEYVEETKDYKILHIVDEETGEVVREEKQLVKHKVAKKHQKPDSAILKMMLLSRLPTYFIDSKKVTLTEVMEGEPTEAEIRKFAGKLMKLVAPTKVIEAEIIDAN